MKKRLIIYLLGLMMSGNLAAQNCLSGVTVFSTQSQIDSFDINYPGCTEILGSITIQEATAGSITNVDGFSAINTIGGYLIIRENTLLNNMSGFQNLTSIGNDFEIISNSSLTSLSAISNLSSIGDNIEIEGNPLLADLNALSNITIAEGAVRIVGNEALTGISELSNIVSIGSYCTILGNENLQSLSGLELITTIPGDFKIANNNSLQDLQALANLVSVGQEFEISNNPGLQTLGGLESLVTVGEYFYITGCSIQNLNGLQSLNTIGGSFFFSDNDFLVNLAGAESLSNIGSDLFMVDNFALQNLSGLEGLTSIGGSLYLYSNTGLQSLEGLNNLASIGNHFELSLDTSLVDLFDLESLNSVGGNIDFQGNFSLSTCNTPFLCDYIMTGGTPVLNNNSPGCNTAGEILAVCFANVDHTNLVGQVFADFDLDCQESIGDETLSNWLVNASNDDYSITLNTNSSGNYWIPLIEGDWNISVISPSSFWTSCFGDSLIQANASGDTITTDFIMTPEGDCPFIDWDFSMPSLRICNNRVFSIDYCNYGTQVSEDILFSVTLDTFLTLQDASVPYTIGSEGELLFEIESLDVFECGHFTFIAYVDCDSLVPGDIQCVDIAVLPDDLCSPNSLWDGSTVVANGFCENDSIFFELQNIGTGNMAQPAEFKVEIVIDDIVLLQDVDNYQLTSGASTMLSYKIEGMGMRLATDQSPGHPTPGEVSLVVPNCESMDNNIIINLLPSNDGDPFVETFCGIVIGSYDPNIKTAIPVGVGAMHEIDKTWKLDYTIEFQNTGNDTAFLVVVKDTLSENLDLTTLGVDGASHPFTWALNSDRELVFTFENILLPDSTTNETESHGFINFSIYPKSDLLPGDLIENSVGIFFDFNDPVITNTVFHTIRKPVVVSSEHLNWCAGEEYMGLEIWQDTSVQLMTEFVEYDSIHFVHLDVLPQSQTTATIAVEVGSHFENVLILGDTTFTISYTDQNDCDSLVVYTIDGLTNLSEDDYNFKMAKVYPNPTDDFLLVLDHQNNERQHWTLINNLGVTVWEKQLKSNEALPKISMADFPSGIYWLNVKTDTATVVWKVVNR